MTTVTNNSNHSSSSHSHAAQQQELHCDRKRKLQDQDQDRDEDSSCAEQDSKRVRSHREAQPQAKQQQQVQQDDITFWELGKQMRKLRQLEELSRLQPLRVREPCWSKSSFAAQLFNTSTGTLASSSSSDTYSYPKTLNEVKQALARDHVSLPNRPLSPRSKSTSEGRSPSRTV